MAKSDAFNKLLFELGDQARDRLADRDPPLPSMLKVFEAEDAVLARRQELEILEAELNGADAAYQRFAARQEEERVKLDELVKRYRKAVNAIEGKVKDLRKKLGAAKAEARLNRDALKAAEIRHNDVAMSSDMVRLEQSKHTLKRLRVGVLRKEHEIGDLEASLGQALTPDPGQPGAEGIDAHRRLLEMEDEAAARKEELDRIVAEVDAKIARKEEEVREAEEVLTETLFVLGEECLARRIQDPELASFYPRLDKLK